jgi:hypothetical protein
MRNNKAKNFLMNLGKKGALQCQLVKIKISYQVLKIFYLAKHEKTKIYMKKIFYLLDKFKKK